MDIKIIFMRRKKLRDNLRVYFFLCVLCMCGLNAYAADDDIIEFLGDRYVIHVDKMNPDSEMTLLDVLNTCPEFLSIHGKKIDQIYTFRIDNIDLFVDAETFLANVKAREIDHIQITNNSSVAKSVAGTKGVIDVYYRQDIKTDGKVSLSGSTYGNGMAYADISNTTGKLTVQAYALARSSYGKSYPLDVNRMTNRDFEENLHVNLDFKLSESDRLIVRSTQKFGNKKLKLYNLGLIDTRPDYRRYIGMVLSYAHTFRNDAILFAPLFTPDLWLMIGTEMDYENVWHVDKNREQYLLTDFYAQLDYTHGPWVLTLGDRFRIMSFWNRQYDTSDQSLWSHNRNNHSYLASVGYKAGRSFFQTLFTRRYFVPEVNDFMVDETSPVTDLRYSGDSYLTPLVHQGVLRYSYQQKNFFLHTSVEGNWYSHTAGPRHMLLGFRNSVYWKTGPLELTLGANYYYQHVNSDVKTPSDNDNFVTLKAAPTLNLSHGFRLSSVLLYSSNQHAHLFATVKANKQLGSKCNVFAEFHDLAGYVSGNWQQLGDLYQNRALSIGATLYPFRK